jgi:nitrite reductase/ring-hydroxylating ferredoxin subunit
MLRRILALLRKKPALVRGTVRLAEGQARVVSIGDTLGGSGWDVVLCRVEGRLYALDSGCPHDGGRIAPGPLAEGKYAVCPLHMYQFDPRTGKAVNATCRNARTFKTREVGDDAEIWLP